MVWYDAVLIIHGHILGELEEWMGVDLSAPFFMKALFLNGFLKMSWTARSSILCSPRDFWNVPALNHLRACFKSSEPERSLTWSWGKKKKVCVIIALLNSWLSPYLFRRELLYKSIHLLKTNTCWDSIGYLP